MSGRTRGSSQVTDGTPPPPAPKSGEMTVQFKGDIDTVTEKLQRRPKGDPREDTGDTDKTVTDALAKPGLKFHVKRILPKEWKGEDCRYVVYNDDTPMLYNDIIEEVEAHSGGKKYRLTVTDPETGKSVAAKTFTIDVDPILKKKTEQDDSEMMNLFRGEEAGDDAMAAFDKTIERQAKLADRQLTLERTQDMLESLKKKRETKGVSSEDGQLIAKLQQDLVEERHRRELADVRAEYDRKMAAMDAKIEAGGGNKQGSELAAVLSQMQKAQEASEKRFEAMMAQQREDKANEILREIRSSRLSGGGAGSFKEQMELFGTVAKMFGMRVPSGGGDDDDEEDDDRPWYEKLGIAFADKVLPKLMDKFDGMEKEGKKVTKEDFMREIDSYAEQAADQAAKKELEKIEKKNKPALIGTKRPDEKNPEKKDPVESLPQEAPSPEARSTAEEKTAQAAPVTVEQETALNVGGVIMLIQRETLSRRNYYLWNYEGAWQNLPEELLEKICSAEDCIAMFDVFKVPGINAAEVDELKKRISENAKMVAWLKRGHDELKNWWAEKLKDPNFDPGEQEEEEPGEDQA
jgi:hypothetical protein